MFWIECRLNFESLNLESLNLTSYKFLKCKPSHHKILVPKDPHLKASKTYCSLVPVVKPATVLSENDNEGFGYQTKPTGSQSSER